MPMIELDGSMGEGGGQILRSSLALSLLTGKPFRLRRIRANRAKPGLQPQHLMSVLAAQTIGKAEVRGASPGSSELLFEPGPVAAGNYPFDIGTAGATSLVLHAVYLPLVRAGAPSRVTIRGGTHVTASPSWHFLDRTWRSYLHAIGIDVAVRMERPGFYPRGGGRIDAAIEPKATWKGLAIEPGEPIRTARGFSAVAGLPDSIAERQADRAIRRMRRLGIETELAIESWTGGPGTALGIELPTRPAPTVFVALGERGKSAEKVADEAMLQVERYVRAEPGSIDAHSADQLLLPLAFAEGPSHFRTAEVSGHLSTNAEVVGMFLQRKIEIEGEPGQPGTVRIA